MEYPCGPQIVSWPPPRDRRGLGTLMGSSLLNMGVNNLLSVVLRSIPEQRILEKEPHHTGEYSRSTFLQSPPPLAYLAHQSLAHVRSWLTELIRRALRVTKV